MHGVCVHLSLFGRSRRWKLCPTTWHNDPTEDPLIIAGDFNDWRNRADDHLAQRLGLTEVFATDFGRPVGSFCACLVFRLESHLIRGFHVERTIRPLGAVVGDFQTRCAVGSYLADAR